MYSPTLDEFRRLSAQGLRVPVFREVLADMETPVSAFLTLGDADHAFLLESIEGGERWGRYSIIGADPSVVYEARGPKATVRRGGETREEGDPIAVLSSLLDEHRAVRVRGLPRFAGGAVGYLGYDMVRHFESLPSKAPSELDWPDAILGFYDTVTIFDNLRHTALAVSSLPPGGDPAALYERTIARIEGALERFATPARVDPPLASGRAVSFSSRTTREAFQASVARAQEYVRAGDVVQVVLAHRLEADVSCRPFDAYRALRIINPSPYMYYLRLGGLHLAGSSPEVLVRAEDGVAQVRPIAGTRRRGRDEREDAGLAAELRGDEKEIAEHVMLVDLGRNDLGRVCEYGSVTTDEFLSLERYSHVMHLVSNVRGKLRRGVGSLDLLRACFPAGTVSGAPKIRAMEIIEELEPARRGIYAGAVGYFDFHGNLDTAIAIRTIVFDGGRATIGVGAGVVADSRPEREYDETMEKARALVRAVEMAERGLDLDATGETP